MSAWLLIILLIVLVGLVWYGFSTLQNYLRSLVGNEEMSRRDLDMEKERAHNLLFSTIEALSLALDAADPYTAGHVVQMMKWAMRIGKRAGLDEMEMNGLRAAVLLHDIGRLGVSEQLLNKTEELSVEEIEKLKTYPLLGARVLAPVPFPFNVAEIVRYQSENWDGSGYPEGLKGESIPAGARLLAVVHAFCVLLCNRPHRSALTEQEALREIEQNAGTQFDPGYVAHFKDLLVDSWNNSTENDATEIYLPHAYGVLKDIAAAQHETFVLHSMTQSLSGALHVEVVANIVIKTAMQLVPSDTGVLFLPESGSDYLRAHTAMGINERHFLGSTSRTGTYLTGRAYYRREPFKSSYMEDDVQTRNVSDDWTPLHSTLVVPLTAQDRCVGVLNLYSTTPKAFDSNAVRIIRLVAGQAGHALEGACKFSEVRETAYTDALTGLRNGRFLREYLDAELNRATRENLTLSILNIDLDKFKPINDNFGHAMGDQVLRDVGVILQKNVRSYDLVARYAGDEFVVVLPGTEEVDARQIAEKLKVEVQNHTATVQQIHTNFPQLGLSIGVAVYPSDGMDMQALLCTSDREMYNDKRSRTMMREAA